MKRAEAQAIFRGDTGPCTTDKAKAVLMLIAEIDAVPCMVCRAKALASITSAIAACHFLQSIRFEEVAEAIGAQCQATTPPGHKVH